MTKLTPHAKQALDTLADKHLAYTIAKATIQAEMKKEFAERIHSFKLDRDTSLRLADEAGVPRTQLCKAIGTSNYRTVQDILAETEESIARSESDGKWSITPLPDGNYSLSIFEMGVGKSSGTAVVSFSGDDINYEDGDVFVIPTVFRNGYGEAIIASAK